MGFGERFASAILDALPLTDALACLLVLGETLGAVQDGPRRPSSAHAWAETGFGLLQGGGPAVCTALQRLETPSRYLGATRLRWLLDPLLSWLETHAAEATKPIRDAILFHVRSTWIVPPTTVLFGEAISIEDRSERIKMGRRLQIGLAILDRLLRHAGISGDGPDDIALLEGLLASTVSLAHARRMLGLETRTIRALELRGVLRAAPWTLGDPHGVRYDRPDVERLMATFDPDVPKVRGMIEGQVTFESVALELRSGSSLGDWAAVVMGILNERLVPCAKLAWGNGPTRLLFDARETEEFCSAEVVSN